MHTSTNKPKYGKVSRSYFFFFCYFLCWDGSLLCLVGCVVLLLVGGGWCERRWLVLVFCGVLSALSFECSFFLFAALMALYNSTNGANWDKEEPDHWVILFFFCFQNNLQETFLFFFCFFLPLSFRVWRMPVPIIGREFHVMVQMILLK